MIKIYKSFKYAIHGTAYAIKNEMNMRIHIVVAIYVFAFSFFYDLTAIQYSILFIIMALVMILEMLNTAIETLVDLTSPNFHELARTAKDVAAGGVLICAIASVVVGVRLFFKISVIIQIFDFFLTNHPALVALIFSIPVSTIFILNPRKILFKPNRKIKRG